VARWPEMHTGAVGAVVRRRTPGQAFPQPGGVRLPWSGSRGGRSPSASASCALLGCLPLL